MRKEKKDRWIERDRERSSPPIPSGGRLAEKGVGERNTRSFAIVGNMQSSSSLPLHNLH